jgi:4-deoxy-L-threo-5-hexosulose-uronate ketol-isomerase
MASISQPPVHTDYTSRFAIDPAAAAAMGSAELRHNFLIGDLFAADRIRLTYSHYDRLVVGGAVPVSGPLALEAVKPTGTPNFLDRRELIAVNIGGAGTMEAGGESFAVETRDMIYVGQGVPSVSFASADRPHPRASTCSAQPATRATPPATSGSATPSASTLAARRHRTSARSSSSSTRRESGPVSWSSA